MKAGSSKLVASHSESDLAEPSIQSDDDVPCFSDIEAMILDMDLDPEDQDLYCSEEVSRYQHEDMKRAIMRLEQGAHSYMHRAIARHGAIAVIHGRHSKHYIKKSKVLLGRATEDVIVDIDLGREGHANIISRRQATINLDKNGSFYLKNLGKCPLSVNDKEIAPGQSLSLTSGCLIEIRGMPFIFETNQTCVKQYLAGTGPEEPNLGAPGLSHTRNSERIRRQFVKNLSRRRQNHHNQLINLYPKDFLFICLNPKSEDLIWDPATFLLTLKTLIILWSLVLNAVTRNLRGESFIRRVRHEEDDEKRYLKRRNIVLDLRTPLMKVYGVKKPAVALSLAMTRAVVGTVFAGPEPWE
ncbi:hypothetical protein OIU77_026071 [Salix suchowensis]|uniref:FHA domain-containing protein n=1 Tax=Salix suchowensis TaxID=1278906 RepID=A0ABQ9C0K3_9ROSI|nr:hypothetical protein OIU77_026071 [Salix suchowensis]